ncbi:MAG: hypothetical protein R8M45_00560 [Ghiorsea sp.]
MPARLGPTLRLFLFKKWQPAHFLCTMAAPGMGGDLVILVVLLLAGGVGALSAEHAARRASVKVNSKGNTYFIGLVLVAWRWDSTVEIAVAEKGFQFKACKP